MVEDQVSMEDIQDTRGIKDIRDIKKTPPSDLSGAGNSYFRA
jgi:hypothetical protein